MGQGPEMADALNPRTRMLLEAPIAPTLLRLAAPNVLVMLAQAGVGLIETYFVGQLGTDALAGMALVFPVVMLMQMTSAGAMGGGIASAIARALGARRRDDADALVLHALVIAAVFALVFTVAGFVGLVITIIAFNSKYYRQLSAAYAAAPDEPGEGPPPAPAT